MEYGDEDKCQWINRRPSELFYCGGSTGDLSIEKSDVQQGFVSLLLTQMDFVEFANVHVLNFTFKRLPIDLAGYPQGPSANIRN